MTGSIFFGFCSVVALVGAIVTVAARSPIRGAVGLLSTILGIAGLFLKLRAEFLAAIQLIVYAGAVVILFVFVIMLLGPDASGSDGPGKAKASRAIAGGLLALLGGAGLSLLGRSPGGPTALGPVSGEHGTVEAVGGKLFGDGIVPFELATALLIVAVVGAIAVAKGKQGARASTEAAKLFHGPLLARDDRGRPPAKPAPVPSHGGHG